MKFLILGGAGMIGQHLKWYLTNRSHKVRVYDIAKSKHHDLRLAEQDTYARLELERTSEGVDYVFFLAWDVGGSKYLNEHQNRYDFLQNNMRIMVNTFDFLKQCQLPFLFTSSQMSAMPHSSYGITKLIGEQYTKALNGLNVRLWNVYGPERINERSHVVNDFVAMASDDGIIRMRTDGSELRQFLFVEDCCKALLTLAESHANLIGKGPFHISSFEWTSIKTIAEIVRGYYNASTLIGWEQDQTQRGFQIEPNQEILNYWKPETSLEEGIRKIIEDYEDRKSHDLAR